MRNWKYVKLFNQRSPGKPTQEEFEELVAVLSSFDVSGDAVFGAGYTYFGQFIDHDLTFLLENADIPRFADIDQRGNLDSRALTLDTLTLARKPALDLDSVYGGGLPDSIISFDREDSKFILGETGFGKDRDFRRDPNFQPLIGDPRNDNNLLVAQIQVLFMRLHNRIVDDLFGRGHRDPDYLFETAKTEVVKLYQHIVLHDFLKILVPGRVYRKIMLEGEGRLSIPNKQDPTISLEFAEAAFRLHSLVRSSYRLNQRRRSVDLGEIISLTGQGRSVGNTNPPLLRADDEVDWCQFFEFANYESLGGSEQRARQISFIMNPFLRALKLPGSPQKLDMLRLNIRRGMLHGLCSGQHAAKALQSSFPAVSKELGLSVKTGENDFVLAQLSEANSYRFQTPLWLYIMLESDGNRLGALGGWLVADTLRTAALNSEVGLADPTSEGIGELYPPLIRSTGRDVKAITIEDVVMYVHRY